MIKGITKKEEQILKEILIRYPYEFYAYGSRVKGDFSKNSDLDILIKSNETISLKIIEELKLQFNESLIPYIVNFSVYNEISEDFYKLIENDLVRL